MIIFRIEHKREFCSSVEYRKGGSSLTGHGPIYWCSRSKAIVPNFGSAGLCPGMPMMQHERCAVTAQQFTHWIDADFFTYKPELRLSREWHIVAYWVEESSEGIDWREDNGQIVFNPAFAELIGPIEIWEMEQFTGEKFTV